MAYERLDILLSSLGYKEKFGIKYYPFESFSSLQSLSPLSRIISRINESSHDAQVHGTYVIKPDPTNIELDTDFHQSQESENFHPVVFVATAETVEEAREIHRSLWNASAAPFIIISLPDQVRIYTGFDYDLNDKNQGLIDEVVIDQSDFFGDYSKVTMEALKKYSADAIDEGSIWQVLKSAPQDRFNYDNRVDKRLLKNLEDLEKVLLDKLKHLPKVDALNHIHAIIGKYIYFQYLYDRKILTEPWAKKRNIDLDKVFGRGAILSELIKLNDAIEERFEGKIFPFPEDFQYTINNKIVDVVASVFYGDSPNGQRVLFGVYDFSYIPIETLSYIYEQFLKAQGLSKKHGAVYTPEALADYLVNEINTVKPLKRGMKILDPCCGSGIFLVLTYRYLIELELQRRKVRNLEPNELKQIMEESIHGVEINLDACYVSEFSLILILLNYLEPPDLDKYGRFKFPNLHGKNIFEGDFFEPNKEFYPESQSIPKEFDWVIGNPPWKSVNTKSNPKDVNALNWIKDNKKKYPVGDNRIEEAFAWWATEFVKKDGSIGFVLPAKRLFNSKSEKFRQSFFKETQVRRITNFSNFHYLLFQADVSAITIVYQKSDAAYQKRPIWHYSPFVANQPIAQLKKGKPTRPVWAIVINKSEIKMVDPTEAEKGSALTWKMAFWGSYEHERAFYRLRNSYSETFGSIVKKKGLRFHEGVRLRSENQEGKNVESLNKVLFSKFKEDLTYFDAKSFGKTKKRFHISSEVLKILPSDKRFVSKKAIPGLSLIEAPHIVLNPLYAIYSDDDFLIKNSYGISGNLKDNLFLKAISIYFASSVCQFLLFFLSPQWGIERTKLDMKDWNSLPVPTFSEDQINKLAGLQDSLAIKEAAGEKSENLQVVLDEKIENILEIPISIRLLIHDFFNVKLTLNKGKTVNVKAVKKSDKTDLERYAYQLRSELDEFTEDEGEKHLITLIRSNDLILCQINLLETEETQDFRVEEATGVWKDNLASLKKGIQERFSQWIYVQRELRFFDKTAETFYICKSPRLIDWTQSQALSDASDLFGETISKINLNLRNFTQISDHKNDNNHHNKQS